MFLISERGIIINMDNYDYIIAETDMFERSVIGHYIKCCKKDQKVVLGTFDTFRQTQDKLDDFKHKLKNNPTMRIL